MESITAILPVALVNGGIIALLWGLVWRNNSQVIERLQSAVESKVGRDYCALQHRAMGQDMEELRKGQDRMMRVLDEIRLRLARENGAKIARREGEQSHESD